jgi:uncharacterized protein (TIGR03435 family)
MELRDGIIRGLLTIGILLQPGLALGQATPPPTFEVASIKPSIAEPGSTTGHSDKGRYTLRNATLKRLMRGAYNLPESLMFGGPKWLDDERYDVDAKAAGPAGDHDMMIMLQSLLAERFHLVVHRETRQMAGYALVLAKGGLKATPTAPDASSRTSARRGGIDAQGCTMATLAQRLSEAVRLPVADSTGADGRFDFKLEWTPEDAQARAPAAGARQSASADISGPSLFSALQEQLGLKLESRKVPTEVLVIDHAEKATEN